MTVSLRQVIIAKCWHIGKGLLKKMSDVIQEILQETVGYGGL